ncbi:MAG: phosphopyruvate hydratase [Candidatus Lokiarchaeota archaeon]|nr:phosphopyruvate hydratase [Candidatus Lokiarchaeota archaeon]
MAFKIKKIKARWILDSRGFPTVETEVITDKGIMGRAAVPSGASTGEHEVLELRDNQERFLGKGVQIAVKNVNDKINDALKGKDVRKQNLIDNIMIELDGTNNKANLGGNAILSVSLAVAVAAAKSEKIELFEYLYELYREKNKSEHDYILPVPMSNILNGGKHAGNDLSIQEFMIVPIGARTYRDSIVMISEIYQHLKKEIKNEFGKVATNLGDEGGFAPNLNNTRDAINLIMKAIEESGYKKGSEISIALDSAASEFYSSEGYKIDEKILTTDSLIDYYINLVNEYPIISIEDPFNENDFQAHSLLMTKLGTKIQIVGDDLFVTNINRIKTGIDKKSANALLLKLNQIGSLSESLDASHLCQNNNLNVIVSHRSGETEDTFISDLTVGLSFKRGMIKTGAPARSERTAKYNRILRIMEKIPNQIKFAGENF